MQLRINKTHSFYNIELLPALVRLTWAASCHLNSARDSRVLWSAWAAELPSQLCTRLPSPVISMSSRAATSTLNETPESCDQHEQPSCHPNFERDSRVLWSAWAAELPPQLWTRLPSPVISMSSRAATLTLNATPESCDQHEQPSCHLNSERDTRVLWSAWAAELPPQLWTRHPSPVVSISSRAATSALPRPSLCTLYGRVLRSANDTTRSVVTHSQSMRLHQRIPVGYLSRSNAQLMTGSTRDKLHTKDQTATKSLCLWDKMQVKWSQVLVNKWPDYYCTYLC